MTPTSRCSSGWLAATIRSATTLNAFFDALDVQMVFGDDVVGNRNLENVHWQPQSVCLYAFQ